MEHHQYHSFIALLRRNLIILFLIGVLEPTSASEVITLQLEPTSLLLFETKDKKYHHDDRRKLAHLEKTRKNDGTNNTTLLVDIVDNHQEGGADISEDTPWKTIIPPTKLLIHPYNGGVYSGLTEIDIKTMLVETFDKNTRHHRLFDPQNDKAGGNFLLTNNNTHWHSLVQELQEIENDEMASAAIQEYNRKLKEFNLNRHLSRFESQYRQENSNFTGDAFDNVFARKRRLNLQKSPYNNFDQYNKNNNDPKIEQNFQSAPLSQGYGTHYATVWVGSPTPQRKTLIVDTGSHYTAFPCKGCENCGEEHHTDKYFDPNMSKTFQSLTCDECLWGAQCAPYLPTHDSSNKEEQSGVHEVKKDLSENGDKNTNEIEGENKDGPQSNMYGENENRPQREELMSPNFSRTHKKSNNMGCVFSQSYTEGSSWQAYQVKDRVFCGGRDFLSAANPTDHQYSVDDFMFGCQTSETGLFVTQLADGIMGLSQHEATLPRVMFNKGKIANRMFGICFRREVVVSKKGISAGLMTLGGSDSKLHSSPMLYATNLARTGWYTVYVKNVFLRVSGGQSAATGQIDDNDIIQIPIDVYSLNSGKGVILDSGTTDTYLHKSMAKDFGDAWQRVTGRPFTNRAVKLSRDELLKLPTILIQIMSYDSTIDPNLGSPDEIVGMVGSKLDSQSPHDILLAVPSTHYMEYSPSKGVYTSRVYFTESRGGVIGANSLQGHDVLFDWESGKIGIAESDCRIVDPLNDGTNEMSLQNEVLDCILTEPAISVSCQETVDSSSCSAGAESGTILSGIETWSSIVEFPGTSAGLSCEEVFQRNPPPGLSEDQTLDVECDGAGLCSAFRKCTITCEEIKPIHPARPVSLPNSERVAPETPNICGGDSWSACLDSCYQSKISSILMSDGNCHEDKMQREARSCHVDFCGRSDPCRVPFVVHSILAMRGAQHEQWDKRSEETMTNAFTAAVNVDQIGNALHLFEPGDVKILMTSPWYQETSDVAQVESQPSLLPLGLKIVLEISLFNPNAMLPDERQKSSKTLSAALRSTKVEPEPISNCADSDLYTLASNAHQIQDKLGEKEFMNYLITALRRDLNLSSEKNNIFSNTISNPQFAEESTVFSSWTIGSEFSGGKVYDHKVDPYPDQGDSLRVAAAYFRSSILLTSMILIFTFVLCFVSCRRDSEASSKSEQTRMSIFKNRCQRPSRRDLVWNNIRDVRRRRDTYSRLSTEDYFTDDASCHSKYHSKLNGIIRN